MHWPLMELHLKALPYWLRSLPTAVATCINVFLSVTIMATSIYLSKQWDKKANDRHGMWSEKQLCLPSWLRGTENPHRILCVGRDQYRITIVRCCSLAPTATTCGTKDRAVWTLGWDSHCFHRQTPKDKYYKPLKRWGQVTFKLWKQTKKYVKEGKPTYDKWKVNVFESTNPLRMFQLQCWQRSGQTADQGFFSWPT